MRAKGSPRARRRACSRATSLDSLRTRPRSPLIASARLSAQTALDPTEGHARGAAEAKDACDPGSSLRMSPEDHLHGVGEVELEIEVAGLAPAVAAEQTQRLLHLARDATKRTQNVPKQNEQ